VVPSSSRSPSNEQAPNAIDNSIFTKYLNFDKINAGFDVKPSVGSTVVTGLRLTTANDEVARDPASYALYGSNGSILGPYTLIASGSLSLPFARRSVGPTVNFANSVSYKFYRLRFPTVKNSFSANSVQIAEVEFLGVSSSLSTVSVSVSNSPRNEDDSGTINFTFTRTGSTASALTVNFNVSGTAKLSDGDHTASGAATFSDSAGTVTIMAGQSTATVSIDPTGDQIVELDETVILTVANGTGYKPATGGTETATGTIKNDDTATISFKTVPIADEQHDGATPGFDFVIQIDKEIDTAVTIDVDTVDGTATTANNDYTAVNSTETFAADTAAGSNDQTTTVTVKGDHTDERHTGAGNRNNELFKLRLSNISASGRSVQFSGAGATLDGTGTIQNDDYDTQINQFIQSVYVEEKGVNFTVTMRVCVKQVTGASNPDVSVFAGALTVKEGANLFDAAKATPGNNAQVTFTDSLPGPLAKYTLTGRFAANTEAAGAKRRFNAATTGVGISQASLEHVVNNIPKFALRTGAMTIDGNAMGYNGPNIAVQNANNTFDVADLIELAHPDNDGDNQEGSQSVSFTVTTTVVSAATMDPDDYVAIRPAAATARRRARSRPSV